MPAAEPAPPGARLGADQLPSDQPPAVRAAGTVLWRRGDDGSGVQVAIVHRPKYDDWSLPKGKLEPGEHLLTAAVRETLEETGFAVRLGRPLPAQRYLAGGLPKEVRYWAAEARQGAFTPSAEVDQLAWASPDEAVRRLTWARDADEVRALGDAPDTVPLILLRHAKATPRRKWDGADDERPLTAEGFRQADVLPPLLAAFGVRRVVSSDTARTRQTVTPYAETTGQRVEIERLFADEAFAESPDEALRCARGLLDSAEPTALCTHRPVLPWLLSTLLDGSGLPTPTDVLGPGAFFVLHHAGSRVAAVERHRPELAHEA